MQNKLLKKQDRTLSGFEPTPDGSPINAKYGYKHHGGIGRLTGKGELRSRTGILF